jgi:DNA gyrase/topoisomerase IV subunit A
VSDAADDEAATTALTRAPFGFAELEARYVLDMQVRRQTGSGRATLDDERDALLAAIAELDG